MSGEWLTLPVNANFEVSTNRGEEGQAAASAWRPVGISLLFLDIHLAAPPWRWTPAWAVILAALTVADVAVLRSVWLRLVAVALVIDAVWGAWWRMATAPVPSRTDTSRRYLPYARPDGPWARVTDFFPSGFFSGFAITLALILATARYVAPNLLWMSAVALGFTVLTWWMHHVWPSTVLVLEPAYAMGLPFLAGAYLFGRVDEHVALLVVALVAGQWALRGTRWRRVAWTLITLAAWTAALVGHTTPAVLGGTLAVLLVALLSETGPTAATDVAWLAALGSQAVFK